MGVSGPVVVVPTYNERASLPELVSGLLAARPDVRIVIVDDSSPDGTGALADALAAQTDRLEVLHRPAKLGLGTAYREGFARALAMGADVVVSMDGDRSHDPAHLPLLLDALRDADVVVGSRYLHGVSVVNWPIRRLVLSQGANLYVHLLTPLRVKDCTSGYVAYRREVLEGVRLPSVRSEGYAFLVELKLRAQLSGFRLVEAPIVFVERREGQSKLSRRVMLEAAWLPWRVWARRLVGRPY